MHLIYSAIGDQMQFNLALTGTDSRMNPKLDNLSVIFEWQGSSSVITAHAALPTEQRWCFAVITADATGQTTVYIDGVPRIQRPTHGLTQSGSGDLLIGRPAANTGANPREFFHGWMDELAIFRRVLSSEEIRRMYDAGLRGKRPCWWETSPCNRCSIVVSLDNSWDCAINSKRLG